MESPLLNACLTLLAQTAEPLNASPSASFWNALGALSGSGFAIWFAYYTVTNTLPAQSKQFRETVEKIVSDFRAEVQDIRACHREDMTTWWTEHKAEAAARREDSEKLAAAINSLADKLER